MFKAFIYALIDYTPSHGIALITVTFNESQYHPTVSTSNSTKIDQYMHLQFYYDGTIIYINFALLPINVRALIYFDRFRSLGSRSIPNFSSNLVWKKTFANPHKFPIDLALFHSM